METVLIGNIGDIGDPLGDIGDPISGLKDWAKRNWESAKRDAKEVVDAVVNTTKKVTAAPFRNAFLLIVNYNVRKLASSLQKAIGRDPGRVKEFWEWWGGNYDQLKNVVNNGAKKKPIGDRRQFVYVVKNENPGIGSLAAIGAAVATATPIIVGVVGLLQMVFPKGADPEVDEAAQWDNGWENWDAPSDQTQNAPNNGGGGSQNQGPPPEDKPKKDNTPIIVGGVVVAALLGAVALKK